MSLLRRKKALLLALASAAVWSGVGWAMCRSERLGAGRLFWLDQLFAARQRMGASPRPHDDVIIVGIDERTREAVRRPIAARHVEDRWLYRHIIGRLLVKLSEAKVRTVGIDFFFTRPLGGEVDELLADALGGGGRAGTEGIDAVLGCLVTVREQKRPIAKFRDYAPDEGNTILQADGDGKFRRVRPGVVVLDGAVPIFAFQVCRLFADRRDADGRAAGTPWHWNDDGSVEFKGHFRVPAEMLIDFVGPPQSFELAGQQFSALDVLEGRVGADRLAGKLVLIGPALRSADRFSVPVNPSAADANYRRFFEQTYGVKLDRPGGKGAEVDLLRSGAMSGIEIHANVVSQILQGRYLRRSAAEMPWLSPVAIGAVLLAGGWVFFQSGAGGRRRVLRGMIGSGAVFAAAAAGAVVLSVALFVKWRWVFIPLELLIAWTAQAACGLAYTGAALRRQNRRIERMFGSAVGTELLDYINAHPEIMTSSQRRQATVLFCDIRGFTPLTEQLGGEEVVELLRGHFEGLWVPLAEEGAWVDKYVGDLVMAAWNVLQPMDDHALRGVRAAVKMKLARHELNARRTQRGQPPVEIGMGLHTGELLGGNIGSRKRSNFTLIGDTVNFASRIEGQAIGGEVLISEDTYRLVADNVIARPLPPVEIRGKRGLHTLYEVVGLTGGPVIPGKEDLAAEVAAARPGPAGGKDPPAGKGA